MAETPNPTAVSAVFCLFWILTLERSINSAGYFILRSIVVMAYTMFTISVPNKDPGVISLAAEFMTWLHWIGLFQVLIYPDPRFPRRKRS
jgi:hypothetical protein